MNAADATATDIGTLADWMSGQFENRDQSQRDAAWFVALRLWCRPLPASANGALNAVAGTNDAVGLFVEQAPLPEANRPYRQRLFLLCPATAARPSRVWYFGLNDTAPYIGAGSEPAKLERLDLGDIQTLTNAEFPLVRSGARFASRDDDRVCSFAFGDKRGHVNLGFEIGAGQWASCDRGIDPETGRGLWGALMGPYVFTKLA